MAKRLRAHVDRSQRRVIIKLGREVKRRFPASTFGSVEAAENWAADFNADETTTLETGKVPGQPFAIGEIMERHWAYIRANTTKGNQSHAQAKIPALVAHFGSLDVRRLTERDVQAYARARYSTAPRGQVQVAERKPTRKLARNATAKKHLGFGTVLGEIRLLRAAINALVRDPNSGLECNPVPNMESLAIGVASAMGIEAEEIEVYSVAEQRDVLAVFKSQFPALYPVCRFISGTGVRPTEALVLRLFDFDFERQTVRIKSLKRGRSRNQGPRTIGVPTRIRTLVRDHVESENARLRRFRERNPLVFPGARGGQLTANALGARLRTAGLYLEEVGLPAYPAYSFRHTYASMRLARLSKAADENLPKIAAHMGHSVEVLLAHYEHLIPTDTSENLDELDVMGESFESEVHGELLERVAAAQRRVRGASNTWEARARAKLRREA